MCEWEGVKREERHEMNEDLDDPQSHRYQRLLRQIGTSDDMHYTLDAVVTRLLD